MELFTPATNISTHLHGADWLAVPVAARTQPGGSAQRALQKITCPRRIPTEQPSDRVAYGMKGTECGRSSAENEPAMPIIASLPFASSVFCGVSVRVRKLGVSVV